MKPIQFSILAAVSMAAAGCLDADPALELPVDIPAVEEFLPTLEGTRCIEAGGNSVYAMVDGQTKVGPFYARDQNPEIGNPVIGAFGRPVTGPSNGIWHVAVNCQSYTYNGTQKPGFQMGWIAQLIKAPEFDTSDARLHFFVADLSFNEIPFVDWLRGLTKGAEISPNREASITLLPAEKYMRVVITEDRHGTFDFTAELHKEFGTKKTEHIRFWMLVPTDGKHDHLESGAPTKYFPITIDLFDTADGTGKKTAGESIGTFTHLPDGHYGNPLGHLTKGFSRVVKMGPMFPDVQYDQTWLH